MCALPDRLVALLFILAIALAVPTPPVAAQPAPAAESAAPAADQPAPALTGLAGALAHFLEDDFDETDTGISKVAATADPRAAVIIEAPNLSGGVSKMLPNHHITKPVFIGEIKGNGQFDVVWKTPGLVAGDAWSKELEGSRDLIGDWVGKKCGNYNTKTNKCGGQGS